jgi:hypothetical protein
MTACLSIYPSVSLSVSLSVSRSVSLSVSLSVCLTACRSVRLSAVCRSVGLSVSSITFSGLVGSAKVLSLISSSHCHRTHLVGNGPLG